MKNPLAVQWYTFRDTPVERRPEVLRELADAGYGAIEPIDVRNDPRRLRADLDAAGLTVSSIHADLLDWAPAEVVEVAGVLGADTAIFPWIAAETFQKRDSILNLADRLNRVAARLADDGVRVGYHNHEFELANRVDGRSGLEVLADALDPRVVLEVDIYWATVGGEHMPDLLRRLGDRVRLLHVKDGPATDPQAPMTAVGAGRVPVVEALAAAPSAQWHIVELDRCATDVLAAVQQSARWLFEHGPGYPRGAR
ncbi:sugar phosphate isomerase/epimerase family protein [Plantactinospora siamensis]|uniref:Sugar phosphate isomerase/epimerase family protein n=1 Tax=Plantactinospora siamensis TaxID=555372 RepID=A0ABV6P3E8_9ACTN